MSIPKEGLGSLEKSVLIFQEQAVRRVWNVNEDRWFFVVVDVVQILTDSINPSDYIKKMRSREPNLAQGWGQFVTPLWVETVGGRQKMNCSDIEGIFRIIQSIPSPKAEPFKLWLAKVGYERLQETVDPERSVIRARKNWQALGYSKKWVEQRMRGQEVRNKLTDYWGEHGVREGVEYAKLTDLIHNEWSGLTTREHKDLKNIDRENLRDHMSEAELIFTALAELSTNQIAEAEKAEGFGLNVVAAQQGGQVAKTARKLLESKTGKSIISKGNFLPVSKQKKVK